MNSMILGVARHLLTAAGGALVSSGYLNSSEAEAVVGAVLTLIGTAASIYAKRRSA